jgi:hypothetical protein
VAYKEADYDWKLDLFVSLQGTTNYNKSSIVITAYITLKAHLLQSSSTSRIQWPMP